MTSDIISSVANVRLASRKVTRSGLQQMSLRRNRFPSAFAIKSALMFASNFSTLFLLRLITIAFEEDSFLRSTDKLVFLRIISM